MTTSSEPPLLEDCDFYHSMDLPGWGTAEGQWDLRGRFDEYVGGIDVAGKHVLDVGTASGFLSFEAEKRGARVTSFDADSAARYQTIYLTPAGRAYDRQREYERLRAGYWLAHDAFDSRAEVKYGDIYDLSRSVPDADIVLLGQVLVHIRDPLQALREACAVARERVVIVEGSFHSTTPIARLLGAGPTAIHGFWHLSDAAYAQWLSHFGFRISTTQAKKYRCNVAGMPPMTEVWTFVADRIA